MNTGYLNHDPQLIFQFEATKHRTVLFNSKKCSQLFNYSNELQVVNDNSIDFGKGWGEVSQDNDKLGAYPP